MFSKFRIALILTCGITICWINIVVAESGTWSGADLNVTAYRNGNTGIGTSTIGSKLQINGNAAIGYSASTAAPSNGLAVYGQAFIGQATDGVSRKLVVGDAANMAVIKLYTGTGSWSSIYFGDGASGSAEYEGVVQYNHSDNHMDFYTNHLERMRITNSGQVAIGKTTTAATLDVAGAVKADSVIATKIKINSWTLESPPDYVFGEQYNLPKLPEVEKFVKENKHLPNIPSANRMKKDGIDLVKMNMSLLEKVEQLTLYAIEQEKRINTLEKKVVELNSSVQNQ